MREDNPPDAAADPFATFGADGDDFRTTDRRSYTITNDGAANATFTASLSGTATDRPLRNAKNKGQDFSRPCSYEPCAAGR